MWTDSAILRFTLLSALIGFITFCICYSYLVWRKRNMHTRAQPAAARRWQWLQRWSLALLVFGVLSMAFAAVMRQIVSVEGYLRGEELFAVRARDQARPVRVADVGKIEAQTPLVEFASTQSHNEREALEIKRNRLLAERELLAIQPLPLDAELIRHHQNAVVNERECRTTFDQLIGAATTTERDLFDQIFKKELSLIQVRGDLNVARKKLEHTQARLVLAGKQLERERGMQRRGWGSAQEVEERSKEMQSISAEVAEHRNRAATSEADLRQTQESLANLQKIAQKQNSTLSREMDRLLESVRAASQTLLTREQELAKDKELALQRRQKELAQLDWKIREAAAQYDGIARNQEVQAPFGGWVVYRAPSPGVAREHGVLVVLSPENRFGFQAKIASAQVAALRDAGEVTLDVGEGNLQRRFPGRFVRASAVAGEPTQSLVELECQPPAEVIEAMLDGPKVRARFVWQPPLFSLWPFVLGFIFALAGLLGNITGLLFSRGESPERAAAQSPAGPGPVRPVRAIVADPVASRRHQPSLIALPEREDHSASKVEIGIMPAAPPSSSDTAVAHDTRHDIDLAPAPAPVFADVGQAAEVVEMTAIHLREAIIHGMVSEETVASAEWMLDRHHSRAIRIFRSVFRQDRSYLDHLDALSNQSGESPLRARVLRILDAAGSGPSQLLASASTNRTRVADVPNTHHS